jgi:hypothetical protein
VILGLPRRQARIKLGSYGFPFLRRTLSIPLDQARAHMHVMGITGSGKSRFLAGLFLSLYEAGLSATLIDPHGDLSRLVLGKLVEHGAYREQHAFDRIIYLDLPGAARRGLYMPFNVLDQPNLSPSSIASNTVQALHRAWPSLADGAAPRFDRLVQNSVKVLVSNHVPLPALAKFLMEKPFRDQLLAREPDQDIVSMWRDWYDRLPERLRLEYIDSTLTRVSLLAFDPVLKYSLLAPNRVLDFRRIIHTNRCVIVNLAVENLEARKLLGCFLTVLAEQGALSRADIPDEERRGSHHLILDECFDFTAQNERSLSAMLSQTRKYGLYAVLAHQNWTQASAALKGSLQNVGIDVAFQLGAEDARYSAPIFGRIEPKTVRVATDPGEAESAGMAEQWYEWHVAFQDLLQARAFIRLPGNRRHWWQFWRSRARRTLEIRALPVPDARAPQSVLARTEDEYLRRYFLSEAQIRERAFAQFQGSATGEAVVRAIPDS